MLLGLLDLLPGILRVAVLLCQLQFQLLDLALPCQHAVQLAVRRVEQHAVRADQMSLRRDEPAARRQLRALRITLCHVRHGIHMGQPVAHHRQHFRVLALHITQQRLQLRRLVIVMPVARRRKQRQLRRRRIAPCGGSIQRRQGQRIQPFAQHGFQRVFPAALDAYRLPQARQFIQLVLLQPGIQVLVAVDLALQLLQGMQPGLGLRQHAFLLLQRIALVAPLRIRQRQLFLQVCQFLDLFGAFLFKFGHLLLCLLQRTAIGTRQIVFFQHQTQAA